VFKFKTITAIFVALAAGILYLVMQDDRFFYLYILLFLLWAGLVALGAFHISLAFFGSNISKLKTLKSEILLSFDDGPDPVYTPQILDILKKHQAKAVFFCIGRKILEHPHIVKQIVAEGHLIGNHTFSHEIKFTSLPLAYVQKELLQTENVLVDLGIASLKLFRPPFGVTNPTIVAAAKTMHLKIIGWSKRSLDTVLIDPEKILKRIANNLQAGDIILFHDTMALTPQVLDTFLQIATQKGFSLDALETLKLESTK
jgi:peptidoglycan-N-acetylglucosamine deacetylase